MNVDLETNDENCKGLKKIKLYIYENPMQVGGGCFYTSPSV